MEPEWKFQVNFGVAASLAPSMSGRWAHGFLVHGLDRHCLTWYQGERQDPSWDEQHGRSCHQRAGEASAEKQRETVLACLAPPHSLHITVIPRAGARIPAHTALRHGCPLLLACETGPIAETRGCTKEDFCFIH